MGFFEVFAGALAGFYALIPSFGLAIILLTLSVRLLLLPLSIKQTRSMREMQKIQPEVKKLQTKHKGDRQKLNEATMALYKQHGVNPFGGCLPLLAQFPVLIGLYYTVRFNLKYMGFRATEVAGSGFLSFTRLANAQGIQAVLQSSALAAALDHNALATNRFLGLRLDCSAAEAVAGKGSLTVQAACGSGVVSAIPYLLLIGFMGFTTYYQQKQMQATRGPGDQQAQQMQMFGRIMPIILIVFGFNFPAGVVMYWFTTNLWTIGQQRLMLGRFGAPPALDASPRKAAKSPDGKASPAKDGKASASGKSTSKRRPDQPPKAKGGQAAKGKGSQAAKTTKAQQTKPGKPGTAQGSAAAGNGAATPPPRRSSAAASKKKRRR